MIKNYFLTAIRNLLKNWSYSLINIIGLSIGIAASLFIALYVIHETSYDRFHANADQIYRIGVEGQFSSEIIDQVVTAAPMAQAMIQDYPEVKNAVRLREAGDWLMVYGDRKFNEDNVLFADSSFFDVFSFDLIKGDPKNALRLPHSLVMTETTAKKYFGNEEAIGKLIKVESDTTLYKVTGVVADPPENSHFHFEMLGSLSTLSHSRSTFWISHNYYTYLLLNEDADPGSLEKKMENILPKYVGPQIAEVMGVSLDEFESQGNYFGYFLQPLTDIHLKSSKQYEIEPNGNLLYVVFFSIIAVFILIIACINFTNLATARAANRAKEVGIRKVSGATRQHLIFQFLTESIIISFISMLIALLIVKSLMPEYNNLLQLSLSFKLFEGWYIVPALLFLVLFVGLLAGLYPSFVLSSFRPVAVLKGKLKSGAKSGLLRNILVISQLVISIVILIGTYVVWNQLNYIQNKDLGFNKENIVAIKRSDALDQQIEAFKQELMQNPNIVSISNANTIPGENFSNNAFFMPGTNDTKLLHQAWVNYDYDKVFNFTLKEGRFFSRDFPSDSVSIVINEKAAKNLGWEEPLGEKLLYPWGRNGETREMTVVGVVEDFHFKSMQVPIEPVIFTLIPGNWEGYVLVKIMPENQQSTINSIQQTWNSFTSEYPFEYFFFKKHYDELFKNEMITSRIFLVFSIISIVIAGLGLLGLISFMTIQRNKEIGVRKTFGSTSWNIVLILNKEIIKLVVISSLIAIPLSWWAMSRWMEDFAYKAEMPVAMFAIIPLVALLIALIIVSYQSAVAALRNPADILRYE